MDELEFKEYLESIKDTEEFIRLDSFIRFTEQLGNTLMEKMKRYLMFHHPQPGERKITEMPKPDFDYFKMFFEQYRHGKQAEINYTEKGLIDLGETLHLKQPLMYAAGAGRFTDCYITLTDGTQYILKIPLVYKSVSGVVDSACIYCTPIATGIAKKMGVSTSENTLAERSDGQNRIMSKNFLDPNTDELIHCMKGDNYNTISSVYNGLEMELTARHFTKTEIDAVKEEYLKQEFLARIIGLKDQHSDNIGVVISTYMDGKRAVKMAPMFDYDYAFHIAQDLNLAVRRCDNGKTDIGSLIEQYQDDKKFMQFVDQALNVLDMQSVFQSIYEDTGVTVFERAQFNDTLILFRQFVDENIQRAKETMQRINDSRRGEK